MKFQIVSDLHIETNKLSIIDKLKPVAPNLILAGDVGRITDPNFEKIFAYISENWEKVFYVPGNHEYYDDTGILTIERINNILLNMCEKYKIYFLNDSYIEFDNIIIIGSVLWSCPTASERRMMDFDMNIFDEEGCINLERFQNLNKKCIKYLEKTLDNITKLNKPIVVITHFMPLMNKDIPNTMYPINPDSDSYFGNELYHLISKAKVWISGHTHQKFNIMLKEYHWICNPIGQNDENIKYDNLVIDIY